MKKAWATVSAVALAAASVFAQTSSREQLTRGQTLWEQRLAKSATLALEAASKDPSTAAEAHEALGRMYTFRGWQADNVYPGWHDEPSLREKALTELGAAVAADPNRASAREALRIAEGFAAAESVDPAPPRSEIRALDQKLQAATTVDGIIAAIDERAKAQADPSPYFTGAQMLIDRDAFAQAMALADRGAEASDRFIDENLSAYQLTGKSQGSFARGRATAADLVGWALYLQKDYARAREKLEAAARLSQDQDVANQFHLGELARSQSDARGARDHYLTALSIAGGPAPLRQRVTQALTALVAKDPDAFGGFDAWLEAELSRRRDERKASALTSLVDRPLPKLTLTTVDGRPYDTSSLRGKVLLLNFFASW